jgi:hypothetical protein
MLVYFMVIGYILLSFDIFNGHLVYFVVIWYIFSTYWYIVPRKICQPRIRGVDFFGEKQSEVVESFLRTHSCSQLFCLEKFLSSGWLFQMGLKSVDKLRQVMYVRSVHK